MKNPITATLRGMLDVHGATQKVSVTPSVDGLDGRTALVTGANRGLGRAVAVELARREARVIMACRTAAADTVGQVQRESGSTAVELRRVDLADLRTVAALCEDLARDGVTIDVLVLNAGVVPASARPTAQGLELMIGVNFVANVALVEGLLDAGVLRPDAARPPRIVFVSSESHRGAGPADTEALAAMRPYGAMGSMRVYGYSKFLLTTYACELARRLGNRASVHACCPGPIDSDIAREAPAWIKPVLAVVMKRFFRSPGDAAAPVVHLACARELDTRSGAYLHLMNEKQPDAACTGVDGERLVQASRELIASKLEERSTHEQRL